MNVDDMNVNDTMSITNDGDGSLVHQLSFGEINMIIL